VAVPLQALGHCSSVEVTVTVAGGSVSIVTVSSVLHPIESVTVTLYVPRQRPVAVCVVWLPAFAPHCQVYGLVPWSGVTVAVPSQLLSQVASVTVLVTSHVTAGPNTAI
jgi:hypothetical protein